MKLAILGQNGGWHTESLRGALARRGLSAECYPVTQLAARVATKPRLTAATTPLDDHDIVFVRAIPAGSLEQVVFRMDALRLLEDGGVRVVNSAFAIEHGVDKYYTSARLQDAGVPTPRTVVAERFEEALVAFEEFGGDVVVKPLFGSEGRGIVRVTDGDTAYRVFRALELGRYIYCVQEFVPHGHEDIRIFVVGERVVGAMLRRGHGWKTNAAQGAKGEPVESDDRLIDLSLRATRVVGAEHAGVDILPGEDGEYSVIEVNTIPGWRALPPPPASMPRTASSTTFSRRRREAVDGRRDRLGGAICLPVRGEHREAGQRVAARRLRRHALRGLPDQRRGDRAGAARCRAATVGETIARAAADTRRLVAVNTNLGLILLLAPLAKAAAGSKPAGLRAAVTASSRPDCAGRRPCLRGHPCGGSRRHGRDRPPRRARRGHRDLTRGDGRGMRARFDRPRIRHRFRSHLCAWRRDDRRCWRDGAGFSTRS